MPQLLRQAPSGTEICLDDTGRCITVPEEVPVELKDFEGSNIEISTSGAEVYCEAQAPESSAPLRVRFSLAEENPSKSLAEIINSLRVALNGRW